MFLFNGINDVDTMGNFELPVGKGINLVLERISCLVEFTVKNGHGYLQGIKPMLHEISHIYAPSWTKMVEHQEIDKD